MIEITTSVLFLVSSLYGGAVSATTTEDVSQAKAEPVQKQEYSNVIVDDSGKSITLEQYVRKYFKDDPILAEIAMCESTFRHYDKNGEVLKGKVNKGDVGVMQINKYYHLERAKKMGLDLNTVEGNMTFAKKLYESEGTRPWKSSFKCWGKFAKTDSSIGNNIEG